MSQNTSQNGQRRRLQLKPLQILLLGIMMLLTIIELKYKQGETPLFEGDGVGIIFSLLGLSLAVYFVTWVALSFTKDFTYSTGSLPIVVWHMSCTSGAIACGLLSSILVPCYGWVIFFFYALPLWLAPCKPHLRILRRFRPPSNTRQDDDSIAIILEERLVVHPPPPAFDTQEPSSGCNSFEDPFSS